MSKEPHVLREDGIIDLYTDDFVVLKDVEQGCVNQVSDRGRVIILIEDETDGSGNDSKSTSLKNVLGIILKS